MTRLQRRCVAAIDRALARAGLRPTYRVQARSCVHADFHVVQNAYEIFIYPDEVALGFRGQRRLLALRDFDGVEAELLRSLGEFVERCLSGDVPFPEMREARRRRRLGAPQPRPW